MALDGTRRRFSLPSTRRRRALPDAPQMTAKPESPPPSHRQVHAVHTRSEVGKQGEHGIRRGAAQPDCVLSAFGQPRRCEANSVLHKRHLFRQPQAQVFDFLVSRHSVSENVRSDYEITQFERGISEIPRPPTANQEAHGNISILHERKNAEVVRRQSTGDLAGIRAVKSAGIFGREKGSCSPCYLIEQHVPQYRERMLHFKGSGRESTVREEELCSVGWMKEVRVMSDEWSFESDFPCDVLVGEIFPFSPCKNEKISPLSRKLRGKRRVSLGCSKYFVSLKATRHRRSSAPGATISPPLANDSVCHNHGCDTSGSYTRGYKMKYGGRTSASYKKGLSFTKFLCGMSRGITTVWDERKGSGFFGRRESLNFHINSNGRRNSCSRIYAIRRSLGENVQGTEKIEMRLPIPIRRTIRDGLRGPIYFGEILLLLTHKPD